MDHDVKPNEEMATLFKEAKAKTPSHKREDNSPKTKKNLLDRTLDSREKEKRRRKMNQKQRKLNKDK